MRTADRITVRQGDQEAQTNCSPELTGRRSVVALSNLPAFPGEMGNDLSSGPVRSRTTGCLYRERALTGVGRRNILRGLPFDGLSHLRGAMPSLRVVSRAHGRSFPVRHQNRVASVRVMSRAGASACRRCCFGAASAWQPVGAGGHRATLAVTASAWGCTEPWRTDRFYFQTSLATVH